jgi:hypothetical protein
LIKIRAGSWNIETLSAEGRIKKKDKNATQSVKVWLKERTRETQATTRRLAFVLGAAL